MTSKTSTHARTLWTDTVVVVSKTDRHAKRPAQPDRPAPTTPAAHEKEADRWVAQMMFENYNP